MVDKVVDQTGHFVTLRGFFFIQTLRGQIQILRLGLMRLAEQRQWTVGKSPYPGLRAFEEEDAAIFFGATEASEFADHLNKSDLFAADRTRLRERLLADLGEAEYNRRAAEGADLGVDGAVDRALARVRG